MTEPSINPNKHIYQAAQRAYDAASREIDANPDEIHRMRICHIIAELMVKNLVELEPKARVETKGGWTVDLHSYINVKPDSDLIADPTWQQFINKDVLSSDAPKVLVGSRGEIVNALRSHGVDEVTLDLWRKPQ